MITVELSDEYKELLDDLVSHVKSLLGRLQNSRVISDTMAFSNLNPDFTRFVLKQTRMSAEQNTDDTSKRQLFCMTVCLHALVSSVDILMQSSLESALCKCFTMLDVLLK